MSNTSNRAQDIANILWELKRAEKLATFSGIANRAGFSPGSKGRTVIVSLKTVRRDWPHLQWWRAVADNGRVDEEQRTQLATAGFETEAAGKGQFAIKLLAEQLMHWTEPDLATT
jgi:hypothetical protein